MTDNKLGVALTKCYYCFEEDTILLNRTLTPYYAKKVEELNGMVIGLEPCQKCKEYMKQGIILISIRDGTEKEIELANKEKRLPNPFRTGGFAVIKEEAFIEIFNIHTELVSIVLHKRFLFLQDFIWNKIEGLPKTTKKEE